MKRRLELVIVRGLPASGKSTWSKQWVKENPKNKVRVNRDDIRRQIGPYWVPQREYLVTEIVKAMVILALENNCHVVLDETNLNEDRLQAFIKFLRLKGLEFEVVRMDFTHVSVQECIDRDRDREHAVGEEVIMRMYNKYLK